MYYYPLCKLCQTWIWSLEKRMADSIAGSPLFLGIDVAA